MSQVHMSPSSAQEIEHPPCTRCGGRMSLARAELYAEGVDRRSFRCENCGHGETALIKFE